MSTHNFTNKCRLTFEYRPTNLNRGPVVTLRSSSAIFSYINCELRQSIPTDFRRQLSVVSLAAAPDMALGRKMLRSLNTQRSRLARNQGVSCVEIIKLFRSFLQSKSVNSVCKLLQLCTPGLHPCTLLGDFCSSGPLGYSLSRWKFLAAPLCLLFFKMFCQLALSSIRTISLDGIQQLG